MIARTWRGWAAAESADEVAAHLHDVTLARFAASPGNLSAIMLRRPSAGGVELMTLSFWDSGGAVPAASAEDHRLLVARQTIPSCWEVVEPAAAAVRAA